jgi:hypothetical protein
LSGGEAAAHFLCPRRAGHSAADEAIKNAAGLLGVDAVDIDLEGLFEGLPDGVLRDFVKHHARSNFGPSGSFFGFEFFLEVPADGFAFAVRVSREVDVFDLFAVSRSSVMSFFLPSMTSYFGSEAVVDVGGKVAFGRSFTVAEKAFTMKCLPRYLINSPGLCRRPNDD